MMAWHLPERIRVWETRMGAALTWFEVKTPAATAGISEQISARSDFPERFIPQVIPAALKPRGDVIPPFTGTKLAI